MADTHLATVADLVAHLSHFPPDTKIFIDAGIDEGPERVGIPHFWGVDQIAPQRWRERDDTGGEKALILSHYSP
jgi:hypothetical protein